MIEIKWTDNARHVPGVGMCYPGDTKHVPDHIGKALIKQGQAEAIKPKKKKE